MFHVPKGRRLKLLNNPISDVIEACKRSHQYNQYQMPQYQYILYIYIYETDKQTYPKSIIKKIYGIFVHDTHTHTHAKCALTTRNDIVRFIYFFYLGTLVSLMPVK